MAENHAATTHVALTEDERLALSAVVHHNYFMPDVFGTVENIIAARLDGSENGSVEPDFRPAIIRGLEARFKAVLAACELAEAEARHVVDDEAYVSVGLIRNALRTSVAHMTSPPGTQS